ncbi:phosphoenolpyruvate synthase [Microgenomates bacterium DG_75]|nr:MAG: phosphoenolpyruvate synthase [Microgenomates bacterium DG_75]
MKKKDEQIVWFNEVDKDDISIVGGKGANLGEMASIKLPVPNGFIVTASAYFQFLKENDLVDVIKKETKEINLEDPETINRASKRIKQAIEKGKISKELAKKIIFSYDKLGGLMRHAYVAIRSSATAEDLPTASFAGQQETYLNVKGESNVVNRVRDCWASLFEPRAIFYRQTNKFDHLKVGIAVIVQEMIGANISGVMFTIDPVTHEKNRIVIEAVYGLGELIVQGKVIPDRYVVDRRSLDVVSRHIAKQMVQLIKVGSLTKRTTVPKKIQTKRKLTDKQIVELAKLGKKIHQHYFFPQDIEWVLLKNKIFIVQTRPVTTLQDAKKEKKKKPEEIKRKPILKGISASPGMASGPVQIVKSAKEISKVDTGEVLVTSMTTPDFVPAMKKAVAIVTDKGGQTSHAAIVSRELGIPCVVGSQKATKNLKNRQLITVNGSKGEIYQGDMLKGEQKYLSYKDRAVERKIDDAHLTTATKIYVNLAEPQLAEEVASRNVDGVGLLRAEFMIAEIGTHPKKMIRDKKKKDFINQLAEGMKQFCQSFNPRPVVYRATDFKTNEYRNLTGGKSYEPEEENPLLGYRGALRYITDEAVFEMELAAIKKVRNKLKLKNLWLMIPFVRTPDEFQKVKKIMVANGLNRGPSFKLWLMVEVPSNVILLEDFIKIGLDGVSIGSNDLTMLLLGVDRDNAELAQLFNEQDPTVAWALERVIKTCQKHQVTSSICGQAPSVYPDLVENLVKWGVTSISVNPDAIERTRELVYEVEKKVAKK